MKIKQLLKWLMAFGVIVLVAALGKHYLALPPVMTVSATTETETFPSRGDHLDDTAVWIDPDNPEQSLIIASAKGFGLVVYDLNGRTLQTLDAGDIDNVDIRQDVAFSGDTASLIAASRRDSKSVEFYTVDRQTHRVVKLPQADLITDNDILGICLHNDRKTGNVSVFVTGHHGVLEQWAIYRDKSGLLGGRKIRKIDLNTATEGCVGDDELGRLYIAEENHGIVWVGTDPTGGDRLHWVDRIITGVLRQDVEGLTIYTTGPDSGYLLASSQGNSTVVVYDRKTNHLLGRFHVSGNPKAQVDEATHTDGIEAVPQRVGDRFPMGFLILQDDEDDPPSKMQNFKLVSFLDIVQALEGVDKTK